MNLIFSTVLGIDILGIIIGLFSIWYVFRIKGLLGGRLGSGITLFVWGVSFMVLAFIYTIVFTRLKLYSAPAIDIHHALMTVGMIFFVIAAVKFANALRNI